MRKYWKPGSTRSKKALISLLERIRKKMKNEFDRLVEHLLGSNILLEEAVEILERRMIQGTLERTGGKQTAASRLLGIHRNTLQRKIVEYELATGRPRARRKPPVRAGRIRKRKIGAA
jgi:DNA-binding protein Fis